MIDADIMVEAEQVRRKYPKCCNAGRCLDASHELQQRLEAKNVSCAVQFGTFNGKRHAWVDVWTDEGVKLLDVTADQWGDEVPAIIWAKMESYPQYGWDESHE